MAHSNSRINAILCYIIIILIITGSVTKDLCRANDTRIFIEGTVYMDYLLYCWYR